MFYFSLARSKDTATLHHERYHSSPAKLEIDTSLIPYAYIPIWQLIGKGLDPCVKSVEELAGNVQVFVEMCCVRHEFSWKVRLLRSFLFCRLIWMDIIQKRLHGNPESYICIRQKWQARDR